MSSLRPVPDGNSHNLTPLDMASYIHDLLDSLQMLALDHDLAPLSRVVGFAKDEARVARDSLSQ